MHKKHAVHKKHAISSHKELSTNAVSNLLLSREKINGNHEKKINNELGSELEKGELGCSK